MTDMSNTTQEGLARLATAATDALTDNMVERLATNAGNALEVLDLLNNEDTREAVMATIEGLTSLHKVGALDTLIELALAIHAARSALTDNMVERLFAFTEHMVNNLANEEVADLAHETKGALEDALADSRRPAPGGLMHTIRMVSAPETQQSLQFLLSFGKHLQARTRHDG